MSCLRDPAISWRISLDHSRGPLSHQLEDFQPPHTQIRLPNPFVSQLWIYEKHNFSFLSHTILSLNNLARWWHHLKINFSNQTGGIPCKAQILIFPQKSSQLIFHPRRTSHPGSSHLLRWTDGSLWISRHQGEPQLSSSVREPFWLQVVPSKLFQSVLGSFSRKPILYITESTRGLAFICD